MVDFTSRGHADLRNQIPEILTDELINSGQFAVVERSKLSSIMQEQGFTHSGFTSPESMVEFGRLAGAKYIVTGQLIDVGTKKSSFSGYGVSMGSKTASVTVSVRILDTETGVALFSARESASKKIMEAGGFRSNDSGQYSEVAEAVVVKIVQRIIDSEKFSDPSVKKPRKVEYVKVKIGSKPKNANVEVNGIFYGNAGSSIEIPTGIQTVVISLPGYEIWSKQVMVREGLKITAILTEIVDVKVKIEIEEQ